MMMMMDDDGDGDGNGGNANANANDGGARYFDAQQEGSGPSRLCNKKKKVTIRKAMMIMRKMVTAMIISNEYQGEFDEHESHIKSGQKKCAGQKERVNSCV